MSLGKIREIPFPLPLLAEGRRIVAKDDQLMALVDPSNARLAAASVSAEKLMEALVGELSAPGSSVPERVSPPDTDNPEMGN